MALYDFRCPKCGRITEAQRSFAESSDPLDCACGAQALRVYTVNVQYPGGVYSIGDHDFNGGRERFHETTLGEITRAQNALPEVQSGAVTRVDSVRHV